MKPKLLLVEDDDSVHCALSEVLHGEGYDVLHAFDPAEAALAMQLHEDLALALLDLNLAGKNGWDTFEYLTRSNPTLPVVIITARSDQRAVAEAAGAGALMEKPLNIPRLLELISRLLTEDPADRIARLAGRASFALCSEPAQSCASSLRPAPLPESEAPFPACQAPANLARHPTRAPKRVSGRPAFRKAAEEF